MTTAAAPTLRQDAQVIGLIGVAHGVSHFSHLLLAPLFPWLKTEFNLSYAELGFLMTMFFVVSSLGQALAGFVVDRVGARIVLFAGLALLSLGAVVLSQAPNYAILVVGSVITGLGNSVFHPADFTLLNKRVSQPRLGHAFSVHSISGNIGWAAAPVFMTSIAGLASWRAALLAAAFIPLTVLLVVVFYRNVLRTDEVASAVTSSKAAATPKGHVLDFMRVPAVWMCFAFFFINSFAGIGIQGFSAPSLRAIYDGMSLAFATTCFTVYMLGSATGMICGGFIAAKGIRPERVIATAFITAGSTSLLIASGVVPMLMVIVLMAGIGFAAGIAQPSRDLLIRAAAPKNATGRVYGVVYSGLDTGSAVAPVLFGAVMDTGHASWVFVCIGMFQMLALLTAVRIGTSTARKAVSVQAA